MKQEPCEGFKGGNRCGRKSEFVVLDKFSDDTSYSCADCVGRIIIEKDFEEVIVSRLWE